MTEIRCPSDCVYLASAREHPPAIAVRQRQRDAGLVMQFARDFNERQFRLFVMVVTFFARYEAPELQPIIDEDLRDAATAMAQTFETSSRGVIYEHRPASLPAERLVANLKTLFAEAGKSGGSAFERDAAVVLRAVAEAAAGVRRDQPENRRAFLDLVQRVTRNEPRDGEPEKTEAEAPRLIVP